MAIEDIFIALEEQGEQESREALDAAREQAKGIKDDAEIQGQAIKAERVETARTHAALRTTRTINGAKLEARRTLAGVKERAILDSFDAALGALAAIRGGSAYPALFRALAEEAVDGVSGHMTFMVDPQDAALAADAIASLGVDADVDASVPTAGGVTVAAHGGSMLRRNTFEDRLAKYRISGQSEVAEVLTA